MNLFNASEGLRVDLVDVLPLRLHGGKKPKLSHCTLVPLFIQIYRPCVFADVPKSHAALKLRFPLPDR